MTKETKNDDGKSLELAHNIREFHHKSLWEEEKHFTWWISIILSAQTVVYTSSLCNQNKLTFTVAGSAVGFFLCFTALNIIRKEGEYFYIALSRFVSEYNGIYKKSPLKSVPDKANEDIRDLIKLFFTPWKLWKLGVRNSFQCLFLFFVWYITFFRF